MNKLRLILIPFLCFCYFLDAKAANTLFGLKDEIPEAFGLVSFSEEDVRSLNYRAAHDSVSFEWIQSEHPSFEEFLRIDIPENLEKPWDANVQSFRNSMPIEEGEWVLTSFYIRSALPAKTGVFKGGIEAYLPAWEGISSVGGTVGNSWTRYISFGRAKQDCPVDSVKLSLHLANGIQAFDIGGCSIVKLASDIDHELLPVSGLNYPGMEEDAAWRKKASQGIREHRMGPLSLKVVDEMGEPVEGAQVEIELLEHDYAFGSFFDFRGPLNTERAVPYGKWFLENFNHATIPIYWADWGWANPKHRALYLEIAGWLKQREMPMRAHVLMYPGWDFSPQELKNLAGDPEAFQARIIQHLEEIVPIIASYGVHEYDVTNELRHLREVTDIVGLEGVADWFKKVRELDAESILYINENTILSDAASNRVAQDHYFDTIESLLEMGTPIDGIGMQGHMGEAASGAEQMWRVLDRFSQFGLPIRITEYELDTRDLEGQARYDVDFYTAIFAHPSTVGVTRWGFHESEMWLPNGAFIDASGDYKPNGLAYRKLLKETWTTNVSLASDEKGEVEERSFYGRYRVLIEHEGREYRRNVVFERLKEDSFEFVVGE